MEVALDGREARFLTVRSILSTSTVPYATLRKHDRVYGVTRLTRFEKVLFSCMESQVSRIVSRNTFYSPNLVRHRYRYGRCLICETNLLRAPLIVDYSFFGVSRPCALWKPKYWQRQLYPWFLGLTVNSIFEVLLTCLLPLMTIKFWWLSLIGW